MLSGIASALGFILAALAVVLLFSVTILVHEGGHFLAARALGLEADVFAIGFGPALWKRKVGGTEYRVNAIPFGGYVSLPTLDPTGMSVIQSGGEGGKAGASPTNARPAVWWKRIIVSAAGPFGDLVLAVVLAFVVWALPPPVPEGLEFGGAVVGMVAEDEGDDGDHEDQGDDGDHGDEGDKRDNEDDGGRGARHATGIRPGDQILSVAGRPVSTWLGYRQEVHLLAGGDTIRLAVSNIFDGATAIVEAPVAPDSRGYWRVPGITEAFTCEIADVKPGSPAERAGLREGDVIRAVDGRRILSNEGFIDAIAASRGEPVSIEFRRDGEIRTLSMRAELGDPGEGEAPRYLVGVSISPKFLTVHPWEEHRRPLDQLRGDALAIKRIFEPLFRKRGPGELKRLGGALGGPVAIVHSIWFSVLASFAGALAFIRFLNVNLAILNLLPIPVLDGGHIVFALWRGVTGREIPPRVLNGLVNAFMVLLMALFAWLCLHDVWQLYVR